MLKKISLVTAGNMFNALLGFIYLWAVANTLSLDQFGKYSLLISLTVVLGRLTDFGTNSTFVTRSILKKHKEGTLISTKLMLLALAMLINLIALKVFGLLTLPLALITLLSLIAYALNYLLYALYQREEKFNYLVLLYTIPAIIKALAAPLIYLKILPTTLPIAVGIFGLSIFTGAILLVWNNPLRKPLQKIKTKWNAGLLKIAWPAGVSQMITEAWPAVTNAIAKIIEGFADVGIFSLANKVSVVFSLLSLSIFSVLLPKNAQRKKQKLKYSLDETALLAGLILVLGIFGIISSKFVINTLFSPAFQKSTDLLNILVFAAALNAIAAFMENYFFIQENTGKILVINLTKLAAFGISVLLLTPGLKLQGLAYAQLGAAIMAVIATAYFIFSGEETEASETTSFAGK